MDYDFNHIKSIFDETIDNQLKFLAINSGYVKQFIELTNKYNIGSKLGFNIFTSISDYYYRENLHSDILRFIFDPKTEKIGNINFIKIFIDYIKKESIKKYLDINIKLDINTITIERETYKIDILIYDANKNCIFIENKINNAVDMEDQIGRYYESLKQQGYNINTIVYLTLSPIKKLDKEYSIKNKEKRKEIEKILLEISVVNNKNESNFLDEVIKKCMEQAEQTENKYSTVYLSEYFELINYLGGNFMADDIRTQVMQKIFTDKDILQSFRVFGDLWDNRKSIINNVFKNFFIHEMNFLVHPTDVKDTIYLPVIENINIGFHTDFSFGFVYSPGEEKISSKNEKVFKEILDDLKLKKYFTETSADGNGWWVYKCIDYNKINCLNDLKALKEEFEKNIKEKL